MLEINGAQFEGGGQIVRMAVCLSALSEIPVVIHHVRARRDIPGLAAQHIAAIRAVASLCDAQTSGLSIGSSHFSFYPSSIQRSEIAIDVGTAGSISLVLQAWLPAALVNGGTIRVCGGTEIRHSPTIDYIERVFLPPLRSRGARVTLSIRQRGYYPEGGGRVEGMVEPSNLSPLHLAEWEGDMGIVSCSSNLPGHVTERQAETARARIREVTGTDLPIYIDRRSGVSTGSSCTAWIHSKGGIALGKRGLPAEKVGRMAADGLLEYTRAGGMVDGYLADQLLVYLARYGGSFTVRELSLHARTMCWLLSAFGYHIEIHEDDLVEVSV